MNIQMINDLTIGGVVLIALIAALSFIATSVFESLTADMNNNRQWRKDEQINVKLNQRLEDAKRSAQEWENSYLLSVANAVKWADIKSGAAYKVGYETNIFHTID